MSRSVNPPPLTQEPTSVLSVHHGVSLGGAPISLSYQLKEIVKRGKLKVTLAAHSNEMRKFICMESGATGISWPNPVTYIGKVWIGHTKLSSLTHWLHFTWAIMLFPVSVILQYLHFLMRPEKAVHLNSAILLSTALAAKLARKSIIWHIREGALKSRPRAGKFIRSWSDSVICISPLEVAAVNPAPHVKIIYNPINLERFKKGIHDSTPLRIKYGIPNNANICLLLGGVDARKGALEAIEALKELDKTIILLIAGQELSPKKGGYHKKVMSVIVKHHLESRVIFTGYIKDTSILVEMTDVVLFPSLTPHFPRPIYEAWANQTPVVAFNTDGMNEHIKDGVNGFLVTEQTGLALGRAINSIFSDPQKSEEMGKQGYQLSIERTNPEIVGQQFESILLQSINIIRNNNNQKRS
ncbi:MAG: glycosyltransferase family 4 protein [Planctomycetes bacterium]|nr:glycosyltransferase family 4 protein [Planctomycetota bacterium]